jgi:hypothetical protein
MRSRNPNSVVKLKDLQTGEETVVAFESEQWSPLKMRPTAQRRWQLKKAWWRGS